MIISEYINQLTKLMNEHGDIDVINYKYPQCNVIAEVGYMVLPSKRKNGEIDKRTENTWGFWRD